MVSSPSRRRATGRLPVLLAPVALGLALGLPSDGAAGQVRAGWPLTWVVQDRSALSPPAGSDPPARFLGPWEHPTTVDGAHLAVDVAVLTVLTGAGGAVLTGACGVVLRGAGGGPSGARRRRRRP